MRATTAKSRREFTPIASADPGANGHGDARTVARTYAALANGGSLDGTRLLSNDAVAQMTQEQVAETDCVLQR